jgi:hypothetical protein
VSGAAAKAGELAEHMPDEATRQAAAGPSWLAGEKPRAAWGQIAEVRRQRLQKISSFVCGAGWWGEQAMFVRGPADCNGVVGLRCAGQGCCRWMPGCMYLLVCRLAGEVCSQPPALPACCASALAPAYWLVHPHFTIDTIRSCCAPNLTAKMLLLLLMSAAACRPACCCTPGYWTRHSACSSQCTHTCQLCKRCWRG